MEKKLFTTTSFKIMVFALVAFAFVPRVCYAQDSGGRAGKYEFYGCLGYMNGDDADFIDLGDVMSLDASFTYGLGAGYNLNEHLNLNTRLMFSSHDAKYHPGLFSSAPVEKDDVDIFRWDVNLDWNIVDWNISDYQLTPIVSGGLGYIEADMFGESLSDISYNVGLGGRFSLNDRLFLKGMFDYMWTDLDTEDDWSFWSIGLNIGFLF